MNKEADTKPHLAKYNLIIIGLLFLAIYVSLDAGIEFGMFVFGIIVLYLICASD